MSESDAEVARAGSTRDASGRVVRLLDPYPLWVRGAEEPIDRTALDRLARDLGIAEHGRRTLRLHLALLGLSIAVFIGAIVVVAVMRGPAAWGGFKRVLVNPVMLPAMVVPIVVSLFAARAQRMRKLRRVMLRNRRCPHCGYDLRELPTEAGTCTCPECACAWPEEELGGPLAPETAAPVAGVRGIVAILLVVLGVLALGAGAALYIASSP